MSLPRHSVVVGVAAVSLLALTGCIFDDPDNQDTAAPTPSMTTVDAEPTPTADPVNISSIVIDGDSVYVTVTEGGILVDIPFTTEPAVAAAQLSEAIGLEPITTVSPADLCDPELTRTTWGGITFISPYASAPPGAQFWAIADAKQTGNGITVAMLGGQWIGYDGSDTVAAYPGAELDMGFPNTSVLAYDVKSGTADGDPDNFYGGLAVVENDVLTSFSSPIHYWYDC
jgi:hypothetical protein